VAEGESQRGERMRDGRHWVSRRWERYYVLSDAIFLLRPPVTSRNLQGWVAEKLPLRLSTRQIFQDFSRRREAWTECHQSIAALPAKLRIWV